MLFNINSHKMEYITFYCQSQLSMIQLINDLIDLVQVLDK